MPPRPAAVEPLAPARYRVEFTAGAALREKLQRLQALMGSGDLAEAIEAAVSEKLERLEARRFGTTSKPRQDVADVDPTPASRHIPAAIRRAVYERDGGQCRYTGAGGQRCPERVHLEFHHRRPFGLGGDHALDNVGLLCTAHNALMAEVDYGAAVTARQGRSTRPPADPAET